MDLDLLILKIFDTHTYTFNITDTKIYFMKIEICPYNLCQQKLKQINSTG